MDLVDIKKLEKGTNDDKNDKVCPMVIFFDKFKDGRCILLLLITSLLNVPLTIAEHNVGIT